MSLKIRKVDGQGRISLPAGWRGRVLGPSGEVVVVEKGDALLVKPKIAPDLTKYFDRIAVDIDPVDFADYSRLKKALLGHRRE